MMARMEERGRFQEWLEKYDLKFLLIVAVVGFLFAAGVVVFASWSGLAQ